MTNLVHAFFWLYCALAFFSSPYARPVLPSVFALSLRHPRRPHTTRHCPPSIADSQPIPQQKVLESNAAKFRDLGTKINAVVEKLRGMGYTIEKGYIFSPATADKKLQELESVLHLLPEFRERAHTSRRSLTKTRREPAASDVGLEATEEEEELEGEKAANDYLKDNDAVPSALVKNPVEALRHEVNKVEEIADQAVSYATGIDDYTGFKAARERERAKAESDFVLSMGFKPEVASYLSGESPDTVSADEQLAKNAVESEKTAAAADNTAAAQADTSK